MEIHLTFFFRQTANQLKWFLSIALQAVPANVSFSFYQIGFLLQNERQSTHAENKNATRSDGCVAVLARTKRSEEIVKVIRNRIFAFAVWQHKFEWQVACQSLSLLFFIRP